MYIHAHVHVHVGVKGGPILRQKRGDANSEMWRAESLSVQASPTPAGCSTAMRSRWMQRGSSPPLPARTPLERSGCDTTLKWQRRTTHFNISAGEPIDEERIYLSTTTLSISIATSERRSREPVHLVLHFMLVLLHLVSVLLHLVLVLLHLVLVLLHLVLVLLHFVLVLVLLRPSGSRASLYT